MKKDLGITVKELAVKTGLTEDGVRYHINKMRRAESLYERVQQKPANGLLKSFNAGLYSTQISFTIKMNEKKNRIELLSEVDLGIPEYETQMYMWYDNTGIWNCNVMFQGGYETMKSQIGLK